MKIQGENRSAEIAEAAEGHMTSDELESAEESQRQLVCESTVELRLFRLA